MSFWDKIFKKKEVDHDERRRYLLKNGRITDGVILDTFANESGEEVANYLFTLNGVDFESADVLTADQLQQPIKYAPGAKVAIRYDPKNQGNCILE